VRTPPYCLLALGRRRKHSTLHEVTVSAESIGVFRALARMIANTLDAVARERETLAYELQLSGGFAHELRNTVSAARLVVADLVAGGGAGSVFEQNAALLARCFVALREAVPDDRLADVAETFRALSARERRADESLRHALVALHRALDTTTEFLAYARIGAGRGSDRLALGDVVAAVLGPLAPMLERVGIATVSTADADAVVVAAPSHLESAVRNLVLNARDALVASSRPRRMTVGARRRGATCELVVADTGVGIRPEDLPRVFEPFFSTKPHGGTGLGMPLVRKLAELYGGDVDVQSTPGRGTTVTMRLPAAAPEDHAGAL
jgi:signal transduction histidine kinase